MKAILLWVLAIFFAADSLVRTVRSNFNLGTLLMYCITAMLWVYATFFRQIDAYCAHGFGYFLKLFFFAGCAFVLGGILLLANASRLHPANGSEKTVIVLGAGLRGETVSGLLARRLDAALARYGDAPDVLYIVTGGRGPQEAIPEAVAMKKYLMQHGVAERQIITEEKSVSTEENFSLSLTLLQAHGFDKNMPVAFVTNAFHCYRAQRCALAAGFTDIRAVSAATGFSSFLPCYLREICAVLYYWVFK